MNTERILKVCADLPDHCLACGVCCHSKLVTYVRVSGDDWSRLGDEAEHLAHFIGHRAYMRMSKGHCAALEVRNRSGSEHEYFCTVYERRPQLCRDLERGSPQCEAERILKSERVASLARAASRKLPQRLQVTARERLSGLPDRPL